MKARLAFIAACLFWAVPVFAATTYTYDGPAFTGQTDHVRVTFTTNAPPAPHQPVIDGHLHDQGENKGKITAIGPGCLFVGPKKLIWDANTIIIVNTPDGELHVIDSFVKVGMRVQWRGLRDKATNTVLTTKLEVN